MKEFNVTGICVPEKHYMVDTSRRIEEIVDTLIEKGMYFTINRARQYGKTTTLYILEERLKSEYIVLRLSFEAADEYFVSLYTLAAGLVRRIGRLLKGQGIPDKVIEEWNTPVSREFPLDDLSEKITRLCSECSRKIVLMIDEVDKSSDNQIFLSFLGLLRSKYLDQTAGTDRTFLSVILAGVYDIKNLKLKIHPGQEPKYNSPWNIAAKFDIDMSFSVNDIAGMLKDYENDAHTGMDIPFMSQTLYEYTSGYPYLVSALCKLMDETVSNKENLGNPPAAWTEQGLLIAVNFLLKEKNTLFDDMAKQMAEYPELENMMENILFRGMSYAYEIRNPIIELGTMFGFLTGKDGKVTVSNRIFETCLYNLFLSKDETSRLGQKSLPVDKNQFIQNGKLLMDKVMEKFYQYFMDICADADDKFIEDQGRRIFLMYLRPIINGTGNYYIEATTRDSKRTDIIVDYHGEQYIIECKIWHGEEYNRRGEAQLAEYLDYYHKEKGYLLSFNFNKNKKTGIQKIQIKGKTLLEIVV